MLPSGMMLLRAAQLGGPLASWWAHPQVVFDPTPMPLDAARAHAALLGRKGVVVLAKRGPKGGWNQLRYMLPDQLPRRYRWDTAHSGELLP